MAKYSTKKSIEKPDYIDKKAVLLVFGIAILIRIIFSFGKCHDVDMNMIRWWTYSLSHDGLYNFFNTSVVNHHCVYGPGYMYLLAISGWIGNLFHLPGFATDFVVVICL